jgi:hypothetical protein
MDESQRVAAAFALERDAAYAMRLAGLAIEDKVSFTLRRVTGEDGALQMVVLEAAFALPALGERLTTIMRGAHGIPLPLDVVQAARSG